MTMPDTSLSDSPTGAVILMELGKQSTQLAVLNTKLDSLIAEKNDHESRLRSLEALASTVQGGRDNQARVVSWLAGAAALASGAAGWLHH